MCCCGGVGRWFLWMCCWRLEAGGCCLLDAGRWILSIHGACWYLLCFRILWWRQKFEFLLTYPVPVLPVAWCYLDRCLEGVAYLFKWRQAAVLGLHLSSLFASKEQQTFNIHRTFPAEYHLIRPTMFAIVKKASQSSLYFFIVQRRLITIGTDLSSSSCSFQKARP